MNFELALLKRNEGRWPRLETRTSRTIGPARHFSFCVTCGGFHWFRAKTIEAVFQSQKGSGPVRWRQLTSGQSAPQQAYRVDDGFAPIQTLVNDAAMQRISGEHPAMARLRGYQYVRDDHSNVLLVAIATGVIASIIASQ